ncbi:MAG: hypothetical protein K1X78_08700 [Verrucomicrobiaceae bacterium]|nr:hypothetical protein [Verrucomicrobiaceae bacterium]
MHSLLFRASMSFASVVLLCVSCATQKETMPSAADLDRTYQRFLAMSKPEFDELERRRSSGALSQADYQAEKSRLEYRVQQRSVDAAWTAHYLAESDRKAAGIPTPDKPVAPPLGPTGGGVSGQGSFYQSHNDTYGSMGGFGAAGTTSMGYLQGGSVLSGRGY